MLIGITGSIGSGKTHLLKILEKRGFKVYSCDDIAHELMSKGGINYRGLVEQFGSKILGSNEEIDRTKLGKLVFNDEEERANVNRITHKNIMTYVKTRDENDKYIFVEVPLLFEENLGGYFKKVIVTHSTSDVIIERVKKRDGRDWELIRKILGTQMSQEKKMSLGDYNIDTERSKEEIDIEINKILRELEGK